MNRASFKLAGSKKMQYLTKFAVGENNLGQFEFKGRLQRSYGDESMKVIHSLEIFVFEDNDWDKINE